MSSRARLHRQFLISTNSHCVPPGWRQERLDDWVLSTHPSDGIPIAPILDHNKARVGLLLGFAVCPSGEFVQTKLETTVDCSAPDVFGNLENLLYQYGGRWASLIVTNQGARLYLDPAGSLAAVYCPAHHVVASTVSLVPGEGPPDADREIMELLEIPPRGRFIPFALTPRTSVQRLLPNHYLDLATWTPSRHWPSVSSFENSESDTTESLETIADALERIIQTIVLARSTTMNLTAGNDSRMVLACARDVVDRIKFQTHRLPNRFQSFRFDCQAATALARRFRLNHRVNEWLQASEEELEEWLFRTGCCTAGATWRGVRTFRQGCEPDGVELNGHIAPILRCKYWRDSDSPDAPWPSPRDLLSRWKIPESPRLEALCDEWLRGLPELSLSEVLDLFYLEQRMGCWASAAHYGHDMTWPLSPYNHRSILQSTMRIPGNRRFNQGLSLKIVQSRWPELLALPINAPIGLDRVRTRLRALLHSLRNKLSLQSLVFN